jgi:hypothetical protein
MWTQLKSLTKSKTIKKLKNNVFIFIISIPKIYRDKNEYYL